MNNSISIASSAMLVEMSISSWTARKLDKKVSAEVDSAKNTKVSTANVSKNLMAGTGVLESIIKYASGARTWHLSQTLPWSDNGSRLLPMSNFMDYKAQLGVLENNYMTLVDRFIDSYPNLVIAAAFQLGDLFDRAEYPEVHTLRNRFKFSYNFFPVPTAGDFRIDINEDAKAEIIANCDSAYQERLNNAMRDAWARLHDCLTRMSDRLAVDEVEEEICGHLERTHKPRIFRDSLMDNATELIAMLKHLNITQDPKLELARAELEASIKGYDVSDLRESFTAREAVKQKVDLILSKFNF
jgi:hypothetical protein